MMIHLDEPLAVMAASAFVVIGAALGAWWQRRRATASPAPVIDRVAEGRIEARFDRLDALGETMALEIERITEGQRFTTKLLSERAAHYAPPQTIVDPARQHTPH
jgi:hypothetical protein